MIYRKMKVEDSEAVAALYRECLSVPWSFSSIQEMFSTQGYDSFVAENTSQEIVGYIGMKSVLDEADITNVAVAKNMRQKGIARELLNRLLALAGEKEIHSIFLEVRASNVPAITLYTHAGFEKCGLRKKYYQEPTEDAFIMVWNSAIN